MTISLPYFYWKVNVPTEVSVSQDGWPRDPQACPFIFQHVHAVRYRERSLQEQTHILHTGPQWRLPRSARGCRYEIETSYSVVSVCLPLVNSVQAALWSASYLHYAKKGIEFDVIMYLKQCQKCQHNGMLVQSNETLNSVTESSFTATQR